MRISDWSSDVCSSYLLAVPIGALHQPDHQAVAAAPGEVDQVVQDEGRALLVGLYHEADAVPAGERGIEAQPLEEIERQIQPVGLLGRSEGRRGGKGGLGRERTRG